MRYRILIAVIFTISTTGLWAQDGAAKVENLAGADASKNVITTAVPFMSVAPDARSAGMGDVGVATSSDANAIHWNVAKLSYISKSAGVSLSYSPWLRKLVPDMSLAYVSGYKKLSKEQAVGLSLRYFDMGSIQFTDEQGADLNVYNPREFSFEGSYSRKLSPEMSLGLTLKVIYSNLVGNTFGTDTDAKGLSFGGDIGYYYTKDVTWFNLNSNISAGATITNIGSKMAYSSGDIKNFVPTTLRLGGAYKIFVDEYNSFTLAVDVSKLMVPTPPIYKRDAEGAIIKDADGKPVIDKGKDPDRPLISGMMGSFGDAPGGFSEEMKEIMIGTGIEYWYNDLFALRTGYFYESTMKGNRKFFTAGLGFRYNVFGIDFAYLIPQSQNHPLADTMRFSILLDFGGKAKLDSVKDAQ